MKNTLITLTLLLLAAFAWAATAPVVSNATMTQSTNGSKQVNINYDLADAESNASTISVLISTNSGSTWTLTPTPANLSGAVGAGITVGTGKHIVWNIGAESYTINLSTYRVVVIAEDGTVDPAGVIGGELYIGWGLYNRVMVSSFIMDKYELTQSAYQAVMGVNPTVGNRIGSNLPVDNVSWFNAIEYCNRRSFTEGFTPAYSYLTYGTNPTTWPVGWNTLYTNHTNVSCDWTANGYRLPTEAEWHYAASGGNTYMYFTYSGSNTISAVAWYAGNSGGMSHPVGTKAANRLGIFDLSGNIFEWCWDIYGTYPSGAANPHGAVSGYYRVLRGGAWNFLETGCTLTYRNGYDATYSNNYIGFRCVRNLIWGSR